MKVFVLPPACPAAKQEVEDVALSLYGVWMSVLTKHRVNTAEYYRVGETGVIKADPRVELLGGEIIVARLLRA